MMIWARAANDTGGDAASSVIVTVPDKQALLEDLQVRMLSGQGFSVATLNLDHVVKLRRDSDFLNAYLQQTHVTADGNPIVWLSRLARQDVSLVPGSELVEPVCAMAARHRVPVAFFGSTPEALADAEEDLRARCPGLSVVARISPPLGFDPAGPEAEVLLEELASSGARLCLVALGAPKQEIFAIRAMARMPQTGFLSIGAGLDFFAGRQVRAPEIFRRIAAEWLWRLAGNPRRLAVRYAACFAILPDLFVRALMARLGPERGGGT